MSELHLYDFGIFLELAPDEEEKAILENNIQQALAQKTIDLEDVIDLRDINNVKVANQMLKIRRGKKQKKDQQIQQQNIQAQAQANVQQQQASAQLEIQKQQALKQAEAQMMQLQAQLDAGKIQAESQMKAQLAAQKFQFDIQLRALETQGIRDREKTKEDRKDDRTKIQASQQSELIDQRKTGRSPKNFEDAGNDILGGGFNLGAFEPK